MKATVSRKKGEMYQQDMKLYALSVPIGEDACQRAP